MPETGLRRHRSRIFYCALIGVPAAVFVLFRALPGIDVLVFSLYFHVVVTTSVAVCALIVAFVAARAAGRVRQPGVVLLAAGCLAVGVLMLVHGVVTPGVWGRPRNAWVGRAPYIAILLFGACLALASSSTGGRLRQLVGRRPLAVLATELAVLGPIAVVVMIRPTAFHGARSYGFEKPAQTVVMALCLLLLLPMSYVHWRRWRLSDDVVQAALTGAAVMSAAAVVSLRLGTAWRLSWWDYHGYLLAGFGAAVYAILRRFRSTRAVDDVLAHAFAEDPLAHIRSNYPDALKTLIRAVEDKDAYTHGHSRRTAELAIALGERLGLAPEQLRTLAHGAFLHDVGKITIPDHILNKPGRLTVEERAIIETHAAVGAEMVAQATSLRACVPIIRHHHERFDGTGYPDRLDRRQIPLLAAITAVADVWDALTSDRAYRPGWEPNEALAHIQAGRGTHFHPRVVDLLMEMAREWGYTTHGDEGAVAAALDALEDCHQAAAARVPLMIGDRG
jgi:putative nucleotidyltransferase with HDIG domain